MADRSRLPVEGVVLAVRERRAGGGMVTQALVKGDDGPLLCVWRSRPGFEPPLPSQRYVFSGVVRTIGSRRLMFAPQFDLAVWTLAALTAAPAKATPAKLASAKPRFRFHSRSATKPAAVPKKQALIAKPQPVRQTMPQPALKFTTIPQAKPAPKPLGKPVPKPIPKPSAKPKLQPKPKPRRKRIAKAIAGAAAGLVLISALGSHSSSASQSHAITTAAAANISANAGQAKAHASQTGQGQGDAKTSAASPAKPDCDSKTIQFQTSVKPDNSLPYGQVAIDQTGVNGTDTICYPNGRWQAAVVTHTVLPRDEVKRFGTMQALAPTPTPQPQPSPAAPSPAAHYYTNVDGNQIESPDDSPAGATGVCNDGVYTHAVHHQGACSGHGGVKYWL